MIGNVKILLKDFAVYGTAGAINKLIAVISTPLILRYLSKDEFGLTSTVIVGSLFFSGFIILGMDSAIARWFFEKEKKDIEYQKQIASIGLAFQIIALTIFGFIMYFFREYVGELLFNNDQNIIKLWEVYLLSIPGTAFILFSNNLFKWTFQKYKYLITTIGHALVTLMLTFVFLHFLKMNVFGVLLAPVISNTTFALIGMILCKNYMTLKNFWNKQIAINMLRYGLPFALVMVISTVIPSLDRLILLRYIELEKIGEYSAALRICGLLYLFTSAFQISFGPYAYSIWHKKEAPNIFRDFLNLYFCALMGIAVFATYFGELIITIFAGKEYIVTLYLLPMILTAIAIKGLSEFSLIGITWSKKSYLNLFAIIIKLIITFYTMLYFVKLYGVIGVCYSLLIAEISYIILTFSISNKFYKVDYRYFKLVMVLVITLFVSYIKIKYQGSNFVYLVLIPYCVFLYKVSTHKLKFNEYIN